MFTQRSDISLLSETDRPYLFFLHHSVVSEYQKQGDCKGSSPFYFVNWYFEGGTGDCLCSGIIRVDELDGREGYLGLRRVCSQFINYVSIDLSEISDIN